MSEPTRALLLGHPRSGTTLLRRLLGAHPSIAAPPETHLFGACARFLADEVTADGVDMGVLAGLHFNGFDDDEVVGRLRSLAFGFMDEIAARDAKTHWVEKTAFDVFELSGIERLCDDQVRYLGIVRHPLDVAVSTIEFCEAAGMYPSALHPYIARYQNPLEAFVRSWIDATDALVDLGTRRGDEVLICRYEDIVDEPNEIMSEVLAFLDADTNTDYLQDALVGMEQLGFSDHKSYQVDQVHRDSVAKWSRLRPAELALVAPLVEEHLEMLGYDPLPNTEAVGVAEGRQRYARSLAVHASQRRA